MIPHHYPVMQIIQQAAHLLGCYPFYLHYKTNYWFIKIKWEKAMRPIKIISLLILVIGTYCTDIFPQYFTYSGPPTVTIPYGQNSVQGTFYFYYNLPPNLVVPKLGIELDGNLLAGALCQGGDPYLPDSYTFTFTSGNHTLKFTLASLGEYAPCEQSAITWQVGQTSVTAMFQIRVENRDFTGGTVKVDNVTRNAPFDKTAQQGTVFSIGGIDQSVAGYNWIWNTSGTNNSKWIKRLSGGTESEYSNSRNISYTAQSNDKDTRLLAGLKKMLNNITFQNYFIAVGNGGVIKVNSVQYNSPKTGVQVVELNPVTGTAVTQTISGIQYNFDHWSDGSTTSSKTFYPSTNTTYIAYHIGKPDNSYRNLSTNTTPGQHITLYWNEHPNTNVTKYQIWRKVKHNGVVGNPELLATKNRGILTFVDNQYIITNGYTDDLLWYDVRAYYSVESTYADPQWLAIYGEEITKKSDSTFVKNESLDFKLDCFPNPFNPVTTIRAILPSDGLLQVTIYNLLGEKVLDLNNEMVTKGIYKFTWNGTDASSSKVNSGIYVVLVRTDSQTLTRKVILLK